MRKIKRVLSFLLAVVLVLGGLAVSSAEVKAEGPDPMEGFPDSFGTETLEINARDRVDMDNNNDPENFAFGDFSVAALPGELTLNDLLTQYSAVNFNAKIVETEQSYEISEISYSFQVVVPFEDYEDFAVVEFIQRYPGSPISITNGNVVTFPLDMNLCKSFDSIEVKTPGMIYDDIKNYPISSISCNFKLDKKGSVSYVAPDATGFIIDSSKPYLNIVIPEMQINGEYNPWGSYRNIKALYNAKENKGTGFTTYQDLLQNYRGIKIKVDVSNINPDFNKDNEIFFYLHDPLDGMHPGTVNNGVKYDITDAHTNKQYVRKDGGVQEFTFDFSGTYYMDGAAAPDIWLSMAVESGPAEGDELFDVHYCDIKPVIENENGKISLGEGCEKMQFSDASNEANGGLMDVEKATKIALNVSNESDVLNAIGGGAPSDAKQAQLKTLIDANSEIGTGDSAKEKIKQVVEINLSVDGTEIQPRNNNVNVSIPVSKFNITDASKMKLYHHTGDELVEITDVVVEDGNISFDTPSFSYFVVVEGNAVSNKTSTSFFKQKEETDTDNTPISTSHAGGSTVLESTMLISDINATVTGNTLTIDRRYNRQFLSNAEMKSLLKKRTVALRMQYSYNGVEYDITIPAGAAIDDNIPFYGPLYLASHFPATKIASKGNVAKVTSGKATKGVITGNYVITSGDSLYKIARKFGTTISDLRDKNPQIKNINLIHPGQTINI